MEYWTVDDPTEPDIKVRRKGIDGVRGLEKTDELSAG